MLYKIDGLDYLCVSFVGDGVKPGLDLSLGSMRAEK
jgi:hypothetical protein